MVVHLLCLLLLRCACEKVLFGLLLAVGNFLEKLLELGLGEFRIAIKETSFSLQFVCAWANKTHHFEYKITITRMKKE